MKKTTAALSVAIAVAGIFSACAGTGTKGENKDKDDNGSGDPVTLRISVPPNGYLSPDEFEQYIVKPVKAKHPNITIEKIESANSAAEFQKLITAGTIPDIVIGASVNLGSLKPFGFLQNIEPLLKKHHFDINRLEPISIDATKLAGGAPYLNALPYTRHFSALYYNKDIFDRFGVPYPKDGMTWEETIELAKKVTADSGGVQYRGLEFDAVWRPASQLRLGYIDPKTMKARLQTDAWKKAFELLSGAYRIPGNSEFKTANQALTEFVKDKKLAMFANYNRLSELGNAPDLNWDLASYPTFKEAPGTATEFGAHVMVITSQSKLQDAAFQVVATLLSNEVQADMTRSGRLSILKDAKIQEEFATGLAFMKGKNVKAVFKTTPAKPNEWMTEYDQTARQTLNTAMQDIIKKGVDINTALRQAEERVDKAIQETK